MLPERPASTFRGCARRGNGEDPAVRARACPRDRGSAAIALPFPPRAGCRVRCLADVPRGTSRSPGGEDDAGERNRRMACARQRRSRGGRRPTAAGQRLSRRGGPDRAPHTAPGPSGAYAAGDCAGSSAVPCSTWNTVVRVFLARSEAPARTPRERRQTEDNFARRMPEPQRDVQSEAPCGTRSPVLLDRAGVHRAWQLYAWVVRPTEAKTFIYQNLTSDRCRRYRPRARRTRFRPAPGCTNPVYDERNAGGDRRRHPARRAPVAKAVDNCLVDARAQCRRRARGPARHFALRGSRTFDRAAPKRASAAPHEAPDEPAVEPAKLGLSL